MKLYFLGTAGGRTVTFKKLRNSGGFLIKAGKELLHIDPGPGAFVYFFNTPFEPWKDLTAVILSHLHLDHSADVNTILESATESGDRKGIKLFAPEDALKGESRVVLPYIQSLVEVNVLKEGASYQIGELLLETLFFQKHHGVEVYSLSFTHGGKRVIYIPCGRFEYRWLEKLPPNADLMIFNSTFYRKRPNIDHLSVEDVKTILKEVKPKRALITHYSKEMLLKNPLKVAQEITEETGVLTLAAEENTVLEV